MHRSGVLLVLCAAAVVNGCAKRVHRASVAPSEVGTLDGKAPFLKAHTKDGLLYVLSDWSVDSIGRWVNGRGRRYEADRRLFADVEAAVPLDSVALFETNVVRVSGSVIPLAVMTGVSVGVTAYCASNPKACFGSCPTFYLHDGEREFLQAEGFSASVAPSLEARDIDALYRARPPTGRSVSVRMTNEALETHVVRYVNLLIAPRGENRRVLVDGRGEFWTVTDPVSPTSCVAPEGDCLSRVTGFDADERFSAADSADLAVREVVQLVFPPAAGDRSALVLASRQSLLPTFLLYQAFAYMGTSVGEWLAAFERSDTTTQRLSSTLIETLGGIDVLVKDGDNGWTPVATVLETGPLAADVRLIRLPRSRDSLHVQLRMAMGAWRIDYVALTEVVAAVEPIRVLPHSVMGRSGRDDAARDRLLDSSRTLVTLPGDEYTITYQLPGDAKDYELFLESRGYYLEWMRQEWLAEEDRLAAMRLFLDPVGSLRSMAPVFKQVEPKLEAAFWRSRYAPR